MDPINPWVDAAEVRRLAERLLVPPPRQADQTIRDAGFDSDFIGYATDRAFNPAPSPPPQPAPFSSPPPPLLVPAAPLQPPPPPAFSATPPPPQRPQEPAPNQPFNPANDSRTHVRGPFLDRITRFRNWFVHEFSAEGIFILDREGLVIFDESGNEKLHSLARNLALASRKPGTPPQNVRLKIGTRATLEVIPVDTAYGYIVLGAIVPEVLSGPAVAAVMDALSRAASPPAQQG